MEPRKLTKADIDKVRNIEGFPIGSDEDIIALSDAPFYTALSYDSCAHYTPGLSFLRSHPPQMALYDNHP